jgi:hypothetical protein
MLNFPVSIYVIMGKRWKNQINFDNCVSQKANKLDVWTVASRNLKFCRGSDLWKLQYIFYDHFRICQWNHSKLVLIFKYLKVNFWQTVTWVMATLYPSIGFSSEWNKHRLLNSSRGSIASEWGIPAVQTTVELWRTNTDLFGSGGPEERKVHMYL